MRRIDLLILLVSPILFHIIVSAFKLYPMAPRLMLYLAPLPIIVISLLFSRIRGIMPFPKARPVIPFLPVAFSLVFFSPPAIQDIDTADLKDALEYIDARALPNDRVYFYHQAHLSAEYYQKIGYPGTDRNLIFGVESLDHGTNPPKNLADVQGRVWLVLAELSWDQPNEIKQGMELLGFFDKNGMLRDKLAPNPAQHPMLYLYEIKFRERRPHSRFTADTDSL
jgi:hypothetical protein